MNDDGENGDAQEMIARSQSGHPDDLREAKQHFLSAVKKVPAVGTVAEFVHTGYQAWQVREQVKVRIFLERVFSQISHLSDDEIEKAREALGSDAGVEILASYVNKLQGTYSKLARGALAVLYADELVGRYSPRVHRLGARALKGLTDDEIEVLIGLSAITKFKEAIVPHDDPYPVYALRVQWVEEIPNFSAFSDNLEDLSVVVNELRRRGLVLPDHSSGRLGGGPRTVILYGWPEVSETLVHVIQKAAELWDA